MAVAGVLVTPVDRETEALVVELLNCLAGVEVQEIGPKGIAVVLESKSTERLKELFEVIQGWKEVVDFQLTYLNWEGAA